MATINSKVVFITTSPRTPAKMIPEIDLLASNFSGYIWNNETQTAFMQLLKDENFFNGDGNNDPALSARDRINRAPKALGFVKLSPIIELTPAGTELLRSKRTEEVFLRQLLKFQIPSPYHKQGANATSFWIKPYLEIFRLIRHFGSLRFDEVMIFALQLTDYRKFNDIVIKIEEFRTGKALHSGNYKEFRARYLKQELMKIYASEIALGKFKTRESNNKSIGKFLDTKASNMRDYADACFRYLRSTGMVNISSVGKSISIAPEKISDVDFFLEYTDREPCCINNEQQYSSYLGSTQIPSLLTDNRDLLLQKLKKEFRYIPENKEISTPELKDILDTVIINRKEHIIATQIAEIKDYKLYNDIMTVFSQIEGNALYDTPLMLEWNTWRAMTMIDGGDIKANLRFDDLGQPMSTAQGNMADIVCDYGDFGLAVEVTMQKGQRQYETEGEPVTRHLAKLKKETEKPSYCLFIAPQINEACIAHFYALHKMNISYYGGNSIIVPLPLNIFQQMVEDSYKAEYIPTPNHIRNLFEYSRNIALTCDNEKVWYDKITTAALKWLSI